MNAFIHILGCTLRAALFLIMAFSAPPIAIAAGADAFLRLRFRDITFEQALLNPILAWRNMRPFAFAWLAFAFISLPITVWIETRESEWERVFALLQFWAVSSLLCLAYFWFFRQFGTPKSSEKSAAGKPMTRDALANAVKAQIYGQDANIDSIATMVTERLFAPRPSGPVATIMLAGPTGTGKTETARLFAGALGLPLFIVRCNEYTNKWSAERLIGGQSQYQNSENGGELTNALMASPRGVLVLDEIEKADSSIVKILMTLLDEGTITAAFDGRVVDARGWIMFATTNAAHEAVADMMDAKIDAVSLRIGIKDALKDHWAPEILGRLDRVLAFRRVTDQADVAKALVEKAFAAVYARLPNVQGSISLDASIHLIEASRRMGKYGYRELERYVEEVTATGLGGRHHVRRKKPIQLEYVMDGEDMRARVLE